jgi:hypothetical protein
MRKKPIGGPISDPITTLSWRPQKLNDLSCLGMRFLVFVSMAYYFEDNVKTKLRITWAINNLMAKKEIDEEIQ